MMIVKTVEVTLMQIGEKKFGEEIILNVEFQIMIVMVR